MSKWDKVSADMISEEEEDDNGTFIRYQYAWCSDNFNRFIDKDVIKCSIILVLYVMPYMSSIL